GFSKKFDVFMMEVYNIVGNVPSILLISVLAMLFSPTFWTMVFAMTVVGWIGIAYFIRTQVIIIRDREYNLASKCLGTSTFKIAMKNILPFMTSIIVTLLASELPSYISYEVFLAYIGMGMTEMSLGRLIYAAESAMVTPGWQFEFWSPVAISSIITVVLYVVGQNLGDASDPRTHM
ncbi:MAG: ABC transporter permease subunit, partial [Clostridia bacterium]|nr:ABC transporter permease subunit [Clostridia bacterium]